MEETAVIGAGAWGTTLALLLAGQGRPVRLWEKFPAVAEQIAAAGENERFLPGFPLPGNIRVTSRTADLAGCTLFILVPPSFAFRDVVRAMTAARIGGPFLIATKGLEQETGRRPSEVLAAEAGPAPAAVLSGPTLAREIARGLPAGAVCAGSDPALTERFQALFTGTCLRVYTSSDPVGVEIGGALKNPLAIAAGIAAGLALGENALATLVCRGLAEMTRLGRALGGRADTFAGLSGLGDLVTTCSSRLSRNHRFGRAIGRGQDPQTLLEQATAVIEGYHSTRPALALAARHGVDLPIIGEVARVLFQGKEPRAAVRDLLNRPASGEC